MSEGGTGGQDVHTCQWIHASSTSQTTAGAASFPSCLSPGRGDEESPSSTKSFQAPSLNFNC